MDGVSDTNIDSFAEDVPINTVVNLWLIWGGLESFPLTLRIADTEEEVPATYTEVGVNGLVRIEPEENLLPNTEYEVIEENYADQVLHFTTGEDIDETPPNSPTIINVSKNFGFDVWGSWKWLNIELEDWETNSYFKVEVSRTEDFSESEITYVSAHDGIPSIGTGLCDSNIEMDPTVVKWIKVTAIDAAGNESETQEPYRRGCSSSQAPMHLLLPILAIPLLILRRRRSSLSL